MVVHCFRLLDLLGAVDRLQLFAGLKCLAHAVSVLSEHCLFVSHDLLSALIELDDGLRRFGLEPWRQGAREHWVQTFTTSDGQLPSPLFGATFFTITGLHMFHVATGIIYLAVVAARVKKVNHEDIEISGLYWHFVDLVWMFVFPLIYILSVDVGGHLAK